MRWVLDLQPSNVLERAILPFNASLTSPPLTLCFFFFYFFFTNEELGVGMGGSNTLECFTSNTKFNAYRFCKLTFARALNVVRKMQARKNAPALQPARFEFERCTQRASLLRNLQTALGAERFQLFQRKRAQCTQRVTLARAELTYFVSVLLGNVTLHL